MTNSPLNDGRTPSSRMRVAAIVALGALFATFSVLVGMLVVPMLSIPLLP